MRKKNKQILLFFLFCIIYSQNDIYRDVEDVKKEWEGYTSYQKEEMFSFCDFLFQEGHYERCLLNAFQLLFKFPNDKYLANVQYYIARCYEELNNYKLAKRYYSKILNSEISDSIIYKASMYRNLYIKILLGESNELLKSTEIGNDPYVMTFRGYAQIQNMNWEEARASFISAQSLFNHEHYNNLMTPIYRAIENVNDIPRHNKYFILLTSALFPGGGQFILGDKNKGQGILSSVGMMVLIASWSKVEYLVGNSNRMLDIESISVPVSNNYTDGNSIVLKKDQKLPESVSATSSSLRFLIPPIFVGTSVFIGSSFQSINDTKKKNELLSQFYINNTLQSTPPDRFLDFPEPPLLIKYQ